MDMSAQESGWITEHIIAPVLALFGVDEVSTHLVRKIAHVSEFLLLALLVCAYLKGRVIKGFYVCFTVAFLDESIQLLSGRGSLISDVWVDLIGVVLGAAMASLVTKRIHTGAVWTRSNNEVDLSAGGQGA